MRDINDMLPIEEQDEYDSVYTVGDSILNQFFYGNYSDAIKMMVEDSIEPNELAEYLEDKAEEYDMEVKDMYNGHFTMSLFANIGMSFQQAKGV